MMRDMCLAWNLGCGLARNGPEMIVFRFLSGFGGSGTLSVRCAPLSKISYSSDESPRSDWRWCCRRRLASGRARQGYGTILSRADARSGNRSRLRCVDRRARELEMGGEPYNLHVKEHVDLLTSRIVLVFNYRQRRRPTSRALPSPREYVNTQLTRLSSNPIFTVLLRSIRPSPFRTQGPSHQGEG